MIQIAARWRVGAVLLVAAVATLLLSETLAVAAPYTSGGITTQATTSSSAVQPGETVTISVVATAERPTRALVDIEVYGPDGSQVFQQYYDNEMLMRQVPGRPPATYTANWQVPAAAMTGEYVVRVGIFSPGWGSLLHWNHAAAQFSVGDVQAPSASLQIVPDAIAPGEATEFIVTLSGAGSVPVLVAVELYGPDGGLISQQYQDHVVVGSSGQAQVSFPWTAPATAIEGNYAVSVGIFAPSWGTMYDWYHHIGYLWVSTMPAGAPPTATLSIDPESVAAGETVELVVELTGVNSAPVLVDVEIYDSNGDQVEQQYEDNVSVGSSGFLELSFPWDVPGDTEPGDYSVSVGLFSPGWGTLHTWYDQIGSLEITDGAPGEPPDFEVWTTIQGTHEIHVLAPRNGQADDLEVVDVIDYKELTAPGGQWENHNLLNPHMVLFGLHGNPGSEYAYVSNVSSANTSIIHASSREVVAVLETGTRTHAVQASPDGSRALAAAIGADGINGCEEQFIPACGQIAEIITDTENGGFELGRTYNFSDFPADSGWEGLPRFDPICGSFTPDSRFLYVTLWSGGLVIFEINEDPLEPLFDVVNVYPSGTGRGEIAPNGCGVGYSTDGRLMFVNSGMADESYYYIFNLRTNRLIRSVNVSSIVTDVHGMMLSPRGDEVVMVGRLSDNFIVLNQRSGALKRNRTFDLDLGDHVSFVSSWAQQQSQIAQSSTQTIALQASDAENLLYCAFDVPGENGDGWRGATNSFQAIMQQTPEVDPAPDLVDFSPDGRYIYVTLRGPNPATGTHVVEGYPPGVVVIDFLTGETKQVVELPGDMMQQDPHGLAVRRMGGQ